MRPRITKQFFVMHIKEQMEIDRIDDILESLSYNL